MRKRGFMKKVGIEDRIVFISNTLGSFVLGFYFVSFKSIIGIILGAYCILNLICYSIVIGEYLKKDDTK
jgi:hypothetical protein